MSNFQVGLALLGGLVLLGLLAHSAWSARANAPKQAQTNSKAEDAQQEPALDDAGFDAMQLHAHPARRLPIDALIDAVAAINLDPLAEEVTGEAALAALPTTRRAGTKLFTVEGFNSDLQEWESPVAGARYSVFQAGVQLANRSGALNDIEYSEFVVKTQAFADALGATPEFPEMRDEVARARELDNFASAHDAQLGLNLCARNAAWSPGYVTQMAAQQGFVPGQLPGRMVLPARVDGAPAVLSLTLDSQAALAEDPAQSAIRELTLHLDVPQVDRGEQPFARMCQAAQAMAQTMEGLVTDDNGQPLAPQALDGIAHELQRLYDMLEERDFAAGSALARRLFS
jgi:hypothetical protein